MKEKEIKKLVSEHLKGLRSARELEELIGKEKMAQFLQSIIWRRQKDLPEPDFDIEDIMK